MDEKPSGTGLFPVFRSFIASRISDVLMGCSRISMSASVSLGSLEEFRWSCMIHDLFPCMSAGLCGVGRL